MTTTDERTINTTAMQDSMDIIERELEKIGNRLDSMSNMLREIRDDTNTGYQAFLNDDEIEAKRMHRRARELARIIYQMRKPLDVSDV